MVTQRLLARRIKSFRIDTGCAVAQLANAVLAEAVIYFGGANANLYPLHLTAVLVLSPFAHWNSAMTSTFAQVRLNCKRS